MCENSLVLRKMRLLSYRKKTQTHNQLIKLASDIKECSPKPLGRPGTCGIHFPDGGERAGGRGQVKP